MLSEQKIAENKATFLSMIDILNIDSKNLLTYLDTIDFFNKPASTKAFYAYRGGLCDYSLKVLFALADLSEAYCKGQYTKEDFIKVALFKDVYRAELYEIGTRNAKNEDGVWETVEDFKVVDCKKRPTFGSIGHSSYMIMKNFMDFTDEQIEAIEMSRELSGSDSHEVMRSYKLVALTHMADCVASFLKGEEE